MFTFKKDLMQFASNFILPGACLFVDQGRNISPYPKGFKKEENLILADTVSGDVHLIYIGSIHFV